MRKIVFLFSLILIYSNYISAEELTGYNWLELDRESKTFFFTGFIIGLQRGEMEGKIIGNAEGIGNTIKIIEEIYGMKIDETTKLKMTEDLRQRVSSGNLITQYAFPHAKYIIDEVDAFYQNYPVCKKIGLRLFLGFFIKQWADEDKMSYREIASKCTE